MLKRWFSRKTEPLVILAPLSGETVGLQEVPDPVFAMRMVGDGLAIRPTDGQVVAPFEATVIHLFPTYHAIGLEHQEGVQVLIHVGIDTVSLDGKGFTSAVQIGDRVSIGEPLLHVQLDQVTEAGLSTITPIIITNGERVKTLHPRVGEHVIGGCDEIMKVFTVGS